MELEKSEYEIQHFCFSIAQMKLENRLMVASQVETLSENFAESLIKKSNISIPAADTIRSRSMLVKEKIMNSIEDKLAKFDDILEKYFAIPDNVLLAEDLRHEEPCTESDEEFYSKRVSEMEETVKQNKYLLSALEAELKLYEEMMPSLEFEKDVMRKVEDSFKANLNYQETKSTIKKVDELYKLTEDRDNGYGK